MKKRAKAIAPATADEADFSSVLGIITAHRSRTLMSVNVESILTYWEIGAFLSPRIHSGSWSNAVVGRLADYIKRNQPELRGYGKSNLYNMARFHDVYSSGPFLAEVERHQNRLPRPKDFSSWQLEKAAPGRFRETFSSRQLEKASHPYCA